MPKMPRSQPYIPYPTALNQTVGNKTEQGGPAFISPDQSRRSVSLDRILRDGIKTQASKIALREKGFLACGSVAERCCHSRSSSQSLTLPFISEIRFLSEFQAFKRVAVPGVVVGGGMTKSLKSMPRFGSGRPWKEFCRSNGSGCCSCFCCCCCCS
jgi:hypothetical protein